MFDLVRLQTLATVVDTGSFSAAARALHVSQPAVSRQIALLERQLGSSLLLRTRAGVQPTPAGQLLLDHATAVLDRLALAEVQVKALTAAHTGAVRLGSFFSALIYLSAEVAALIGEQHPDLVVSDDLVDPATAYAKLGRGELDLAIVFDHDFAPTAVPDTLTVHRLFDDPVEILLPANHRLALSPVIDPADLSGDTWIRAHDGSAADLAEHVLGRYRLDPPRLLAGHGDEPVEAQALVAAGRGVTLTHDLTVIIDQHSLLSRPLAGERFVRQIAVAHATGPLAPVVGTVLDAIRNVGQHHEAESQRKSLSL
jgi:DNA-binding transcriptional LysR family regulator